MGVVERAGVLGSVFALRVSVPDPWWALQGDTQPHTRACVCTHACGDGKMRAGVPGPAWELRCGEWPWKVDSSGEQDALLQAPFFCIHPHPHPPGEAAWGWLSGLPSAAAGPAVSPAGTAASPASPPPSLLCPSLVASAAAAGGIVSAAGSAHVALPGREPALLPSPAGSGKGAAATPSTAAAAGPVALVGRDPALLPPLASLAMPEGCGEERGAAGSAHAALVGREPALLLPLPLPAVAAAAASAAGVASAAGSAHAALVGREPALLLPLSAAAATAPVVAAAEPLALFSLGRAKKLPDAVPLLVMVRTWASASPARSHMHKLS
eukprot:1152683-Pelagomonas_calceolata.AAC.3